MLRIYEDALVVVRELGGVVAVLGRVDADLCRQLKKARSSIPLNIAEGNHARGARRNLHYGFALGSAEECIAVLQTAEACGYIAAVPHEVVERLRKIVGTLYKCGGGR